MRRLQNNKSNTTCFKNCPEILTAAFLFDITLTSVTTTGFKEPRRQTFSSSRQSRIIYNIRLIENKDGRQTTTSQQDQIVNTLYRQKGYIWKKYKILHWIVKHQQVKQEGKLKDGEESSIEEARNKVFGVFGWRGR